MNIEFECEQSERTPYVNTAHFRLGDGSRIVVDRDTTFYDYYDRTKELSMEWSNCYIWDGEKANYDLSEDMFKNAVLEYMYLDDDAPEGYEFKCFSCSIDNIVIPVLEEDHAR